MTEPTLRDLRRNIPESDATRLQDKIFSLLADYKNGDKSARAKGISLIKQFRIISRAQGLSRR